jgi:hypothetical protein
LTLQSCAQTLSSHEKTSSTVWSCFRFCRLRYYIFSMLHMTRQAVIFFWQSLLFHCTTGLVASCTCNFFFVLHSFTLFYKAVWVARRTGQTRSAQLYIFFLHGQQLSCTLYLPNAHDCSSMT